MLISAKNNNPQIFNGPVEAQEQIIIQEAMRYKDRIQEQLPITPRNDNGNNMGEQLITDHRDFDDGER